MRATEDLVPDRDGFPRQRLGSVRTSLIAKRSGSQPDTAHQPLEGWIAAQRGKLRVHAQQHHGVGAIRERAFKPADRDVALPPREMDLRDLVRWHGSAALGDSEPLLGLGALAPDGVGPGPRRRQ
jgi:hypothetical protein